MASYCFMSTEKIKSVGAFTRKMSHNYRLNAVPNADPSRAHENKELIHLDGDSYKDVFNKKMQEANHIPRKNAVLGVEVLMTYNAREIDKNFDIEEWQKQNIQWLKNTFGENNVISAVYHGDEGMPDEDGKVGSGHIHAVVIPMVDGKLNCKEFLGGPRKLGQLQDSYGKSMEPLGLKRGMKGSVAKHEDIRKFYDSLNKELEKTLPEVKHGESAHEYRERANDLYKQANLKSLNERKKLERKITEVSTSIKKISLDDKLAYENHIQELLKLQKQLKEEKKKLEEEKKLWEKISEKDKEDIIKLKNFNLIIDGLANYPDKEESFRIGSDINKIANWENNFEKEKKNPKEKGRDNR